MSRAGYLETAGEMIARSVRQNEIAHADYTDALAAELLAECDGSARGEGVVEYWGETDKGYAWRCHLETPEAES